MNCDFKIQYGWFKKECRDRLTYYSVHSRYQNYTAIMDIGDIYLRDARVREPVLIGIAFCVADQIMNPMSGEEMGVAKADFIYFILFIDFFVIFVLICFINLMEKRYKEYADCFD
jgi:hypothetical protein